MCAHWHRVYIQYIFFLIQFVQKSERRFRFRFQSDCIHEPRSRTQRERPALCEYTVCDEMNGLLCSPRARRHGYLPILIVGCPMRIAIRRCGYTYNISILQSALRLFWNVLISSAAQPFIFQFHIHQDRSIRKEKKKKEKKKNKNISQSLHDSCDGPWRRRG